MKFKAARAMGDAALNPGNAAGTGVGLGAGIGLGASMAGMLGQAMQHPPQTQPVTPAPAPAAAPPAVPGALTLAQVQDAIDALDMRFSKGEVGEDTYNRLMAKWDAKLKELRG